MLRSGHGLAIDRRDDGPGPVPRETGATPAADLGTAAVAVLETADPRAKAQAARDAAARWLSREIEAVGRGDPPERPARPARPELQPPGAMPRRRIGPDVAGRVALLHAVAHIELNAIDLAFDIVARFGDAGLPVAFFDDWITVGDDEARHFLMLADRLVELGAAYGDLPAHDGLWQAATATADDLMCRLAVVPMVLEARGLDVTPGMIEKFDAAGDDRSADILRVIHEEEIGHVASGRRWFEHLCAERGCAPHETWRAIVEARFKGGLKPPFNEASRERAGFPAAYYAPPGDGGSEPESGSD